MMMMMWKLQVILVYTKRGMVHPITHLCCIDTTGLRKMHWKKGQLIGTGVYGNVYRGLNEDTGGFMAVKEYTWPQEEEKAAAHDMSPIQIEIEHLRTLLVHDNIVPYLGTELSTSNQCLYIFTEWVPGGNLKQLQQTYGKLSENLVRQYTWHILSGLRYLHDHDIVFRDLGLEQVLVDDQGRIKLADFCTSLKTRDRRRRKMTMLAPEVVQDACMYSPQSDIWSVGCIVYQLLCNACPSTVPQTEQGARVSSSGGFFSNPFGRGSTTSCPEDLREEAPRGIVDLSTQELSPEARDFLSTCLAEDPTDRSKTCRELLGHSFFTGTKKPTSNNNNNSLPMHHHYSSGMNKKNGLSSSTSSIHKSTELLRRRRGGGGGKKRATDVVAVVKRGAKASDTNNHKFKSLPSTGLEVFQKSPRQHSMMISSLEKETTHESLHRYSGNNNHSNNGQSDSESEVSNSGFLLQSSTTFRSSMNNSTRKIQSSEIILDDPACPVQAFTTLSKVPNITPRKGNNYKTEDDPVAVYPTVRRKSWSDRMEQPIATTFAKNKLEQEIESQKQRLAQKRRKERQWQAELAAEAAKAQVHEHRLSFS